MTIFQRKLGLVGQESNVQSHLDEDDVCGGADAGSALSTKNDDLKIKFTATGENLQTEQKWKIAECHVFNDKGIII